MLSRLEIGYQCISSRILNFSITHNPRECQLKQVFGVTNEGQLWMTWKHTLYWVFVPTSSSSNKHGTSQRWDEPGCFFLDRIWKQKEGGEGILNKNNGNTWRNSHVNCWGNLLFMELLCLYNWNFRTRWVVEQVRLFFKVTGYKSRRIFSSINSQNGIS